MKKLSYASLALFAALCCNTPKREITKTELIGPVLVYTDNRDPGDFKECRFGAEDILVVQKYDALHGTRFYFVSQNTPKDKGYNWYKPDTSVGQDLKAECGKIVEEYKSLHPNPKANNSK